MFLFVFLFVQFLLQRGIAGLPSPGPLPERPGAGLTLPGVVADVSATVPPSLPHAGPVLGSAVGRERVPPEDSVRLLVSGTEERPGAPSGGGGTFLVETLVVGSRLSPELVT